MEAQACVAYGLSYCWIKVQVAGLKCRIVKFHFLMRRILYPLQEAGGGCNLIVFANSLFKEKHKVNIKS